MLFSLNTSLFDSNILPSIKLEVKFAVHSIALHLKVSRHLSAKAPMCFVPDGNLATRKYVADGCLASEQFRSQARSVYS